MLLIQEFCRENPDNYAILLEDRYAIKTTIDNDLVIFKYNQIKSDFKIPIVKECRGIVLNVETFEVVCHPFHKFMNHGQESADTIDWESASISSKEDGSLIKLYFYNGGWNIATNGCIYAHKAGLAFPFIAEENIPIESFEALFLYTMMMQYKIMDFTFLDSTEEYTHMFELCTPVNKVVVRYDTPKIYYLSSKHNITGEETKFSFDVDQVKSYNLCSLSECLDIVSKFGMDKEGLVVCDKDFHRIKIKSDLYVHMHHIRGEGVFTPKRALDIIRKNEVDEVLTYFPEYKELLYSVKNEYENHIKKAEDFLKYLDGFSTKELANRKKFAELVCQSDFKDLAFKWLDGQFTTIEEYYKDFPSDKLIRSI